MLSAVFLDGCNTVHEYKNKIKTLSENDKVSLQFQKYEIVECFIMKYDKFIYLCNHIDERFAKNDIIPSCKTIHKVSMYFSTRADKVLLLSFSDRRVAVLYNAGQKIEDRSSSHRARDKRTAMAKQRKKNLKQFQEMPESL